MLNKNNSILALILLFYWVGVLFYDFIDKNFGFSFIDEILVLLLLFIYIRFKIISTCITNKSFLILLFIFLFYFIYSIYIDSNTLTAISSDALVLIKPFIAYFSIIGLKPIMNEKMKSILKINAILGMIVLPFLLFLNYHPSRFATAAIATALLYLYASKFNSKNILMFIVMLSIGLFSERSKMYGFFMISGLLILFFYYQKYSSFTFSAKNISFVLLAIFLALYVSYEKIYFYFYIGTVESENMFARPLSFVTSFRIASDYFPFGSGFASFGSYFSGVYYSEIYYKYDLFWQQGFKPERPSFIADTFFPELLGQFGFFGLILFISIGILLLKEGYRIQKKNMFFKKHFLLLILIVFFFLIESIADSTFTHNRGVFIVLILSLILVEIRYKYLEGRV